MKILHLIPSIDQGGTERLLLNICHEQKRTGLHPVIVSFTKNNSYRSLSEGIEIHFFPDTNFEYRLFGKSLKKTAKFEKFLFQLNPDVIHSHAYWTDLILYSIPNTRAKHFTHFHLYYDNFKPKWRGFLVYIKDRIDKYRMIFKYLRRNTNFICISNDIKSYYTRNLAPISSKRLHLLLNAMKVDSSDHKNPGMHEPIRLLGVGRMTEEKNMSELVRVGILLHEKGVDFTMRIAGEGPELNRLHKKINQCNCASKFELIGFTNDIQTHFKWSDIYLQTSRTEPFGLTILEALAVSKPCIIYKAGGNEELIQHGVNGYLINQGDKNSIVDHIIGLCAAPDSYLSFAKASALHARTFDIIPYCEKLKKLYHQTP